MNLGFACLLDSSGDGDSTKLFKAFIALSTILVSDVGIGMLGKEKMKSVSFDRLRVRLRISSACFSNSDLRGLPEDECERVLALGTCCKEE